MKSLMTSTIAAILLAGIASAETVTLRVECRKDSDRGCTASGRACSAIGDNRYIVPGSPSGGTVQNFWSKNPRCGAPEADGYAAVPNTGLPYPPAMRRKSVPACMWKAAAVLRTWARSPL